MLLRGGIVQRRKQGNFALYSIADPVVFALCDDVCGALQREIAELEALLQGGAECASHPDNSAWPLERVLFALAGTMTLISAALAALVSPWFLLLTAFVGVNQWLYVVVGACPGLVRPRPAVWPALRGLSSLRTHVAMSDLSARSGRLGRYTATHFRRVVLVWAIVAIPLAASRPGRDSPLRRRLGDDRLAVGGRPQPIDKNFGGLGSYGLMAVVHSATSVSGDPPVRRHGHPGRANADRRARPSPPSSRPAAGISISADGHTAVVQAGAARDANAMVDAADGLKTKLAALEHRPTPRSTSPAPPECGRTSTPPTAARCCAPR